MLSPAVGASILESLTTGTYSDPMVLYREYVQNSCDALDEAISQGMLDPEMALLRITVDRSTSTIIFDDNGIGVPSDQVMMALLSLGRSQKDGRNLRGFRGIGRLSGLCFCDTLIFETSYPGEPVKSTLRLSRLALEKLLASERAQAMELLDVMSGIATLERQEEEASKHYFRVTLQGASDTGGILDDQAVLDYISQIAPVPFRETFRYGKDITSWIRSCGYDIPEYKVTLTSQGATRRIYKPYIDVIPSGGKRRDLVLIDGIEFEVLEDPLVGDGPLALLWYGKTDLRGTISDDRVKSVRLRRGNMLIGDKSTLNSIFREDRFNGWLIGEVHVVHSGILPNARRDGFVVSSYPYQALIEQLRRVGSRISAEIRDSSRNRSQSSRAAVDGDAGHPDLLRRSSLVKQNDIAPQREIIATVIEQMARRVAAQQSPACQTCPEDFVQQVIAILREELEHDAFERVEQRVRRLANTRRAGPANPDH